MKHRAFSFNCKVSLGCIIALHCISLQAISAQDETRLDWRDRSTIVIGFGGMSFTGLPEEVSSPLNISGVYEIIQYFPMSRSFAIQGGIGITSERSMLDGQFVKTVNDEIHIQAVDDRYRKNYYDIISLSVPLTAFIKWSEQEDDYFQFFGLGIRNNIVLSGKHKYFFEGAKHSDDIRPFINNYMPAAIIQFGSMAKSREISSLLHTYSFEFGIDLLPLDDGNVRRVSAGIRIGI